MSPSCRVGCSCMGARVAAVSACAQGCFSLLIISATSSHCLAWQGWPRHSPCTAVKDVINYRKRSKLDRPVARCASNEASGRGNSIECEITEPRQDSRFGEHSTYLILRPPRVGVWEKALHPPVFPALPKPMTHEAGFRSDEFPRCKLRSASFGKWGRKLV